MSWSRLVVCVWLAAAGVLAGTATAPGQPAAARLARAACVRGEPEPLLVAEPGRPAPVFRRSGDREALETFTIEPGVELSIRHFGCAHYALELTFVQRTMVLRSPTALTSRAAWWMRRLPVNADQRALIERIARRLDEAAEQSAEPGTVLRLSETSTVTVNMDRAPPRARVVVLYEVAL